MFFKMRISMFGKNILVFYSKAAMYVEHSVFGHSTLRMYCLKIIKTSKI